VPPTMEICASPSRPAMKHHDAQVMLEGFAHASTVNVVREAKVAAVDDPCWLVPLTVRA